jgi:hypothetical protein
VRLTASGGLMNLLKNPFLLFYYESLPPWIPHDVAYTSGRGRVRDLKIGKIRGVLWSRECIGKLFAV